MDEVLERELKWDVDEHFAVPRLDDIIALRVFGKLLDSRSGTSRTN